MTFNLTPDLIQSIISAMENQDASFLVDASSESLIYEDSDGVRADDDRFYALPEWTSADGFSLREDFAHKVYAPLAQEELQEVLHSGRGVFKNFRYVLKKYPEIDKRWHIFKYKTMSARINEWYNSLREIWGLEKLDYLDESDDSLVHDDFSFNDYYSSENKEEILFNINAYFQGNSEDLPDPINNALSKIWTTQFDYADERDQVGIICRSLSDDFAGCITGSPASKNQEDIIVLTSLFVPEEFRGLGIGTELISMFMNRLQSAGKHWILMPHNLIPSILEPLLIRTGFKKISYGFMAEI